MATTGPGGFGNSFACNSGLGDFFGIECAQNNSGPLGSLGIGSSATGNTKPGGVGDIISGLETWIGGGFQSAENLGYSVAFAAIGVIILTIGIAAIAFGSRGGSAAPA